MGKTTVEITKIIEEVRALLEEIERLESLGLNSDTEHQHLEKLLFEYHETVKKSNSKNELVNKEIV